MLNDKSEGQSGKVATTANEEPNTKHENHPKESLCTGNEDVIAGEVKCAVKELVTKEL